MRLARLFGVLDKRVLSLVEAGQLDQAEVEIQNAITDFGAES